MQHHYATAGLKAAAVLVTSGQITLQVALVGELHRYRVVGERLEDDLPCYECGAEGPVLIVDFGDEYRDLCPSCAMMFGITR
jgi:hypothetical protein